MQSIAVRQAAPEDFAAISELIAEQNKTPATHCIQSDTGSDQQAVQNEMIRLASVGGLRWMLALQNGEMIGALGCELDQELGRGWTRGPFVISDGSDWETVASALLDGLQDALPSTIHLLDSFLNIANERGNALYLAHGFQQLRFVHVYAASAMEQLPRNWSACDTLDPVVAQKFVALHDSVFARTYATGQRILDALDDAHRVFAHVDGGEIQGYAYAVVEEGSGDGSVEFIGVRADARGKGIGRKLLRTALHWLFEVKRVPQATLVVNDDLTNARALYESVGFRLKYTGVHTRRER